MIEKLAEKYLVPIKKSTQFARKNLIYQHRFGYGLRIMNTLICAAVVSLQS